MKNKEGNCILCDIVNNTNNKRKDEVILYEDDDFIVCDTKNKNGHKERIMIIFKHHSDTIEEDGEKKALDMLEWVGKTIFFQYCDSNVFVIMADKYSTLKGHWHLVASDLIGDDIEQMAVTPWIKIVVKDEFVEELDSSKGSCV